MPILEEERQVCQDCCPVTQIMAQEEITTETHHLGIAM